MKQTIEVEALHAAKGLRITDQKREIARVLSESVDHPYAEALQSRSWRFISASRWQLLSAKFAFSKKQVFSTGMILVM